MSKRYKEYNYEIIDDPDYFDKENAVTPELKKELNTIYFDILDRKRKVIDKLLKLIEKHPDNPQLKNYLATAYKIQGNTKKSCEVNRQIVKEHPNYLFGKLNIAAEHLENGEYDKVKEALGGALDIQELYPSRTVFHIGEVLGFHKMAIHYFLETDNLEAAKARFDIMERLAPVHPDTQEISEYFFNFLTQKGIEKIEEMRKGAIDVVANRKLTRKQTKKAPRFENKEIEFLYQHSLEIDPLLLDSIIMLPRESVIRDLENVLIDSIARYNYFCRIEEKGEFSEETLVFPIHALFLLAELRSEESLNLVLEFCSQNLEFLEFWLGSHVTESLPEIFYFIGSSQLDKLKSFVKQPNIYTYVRTAISTTVSQIVFHQPNRRQEVLEWYDDVFKFFLNAKLKDNVIDTDTISLMVTDADEARLTELLPIIEELYNKGYVTEDIADSFHVIKESMNTPLDNIFKKEFINIHERYQEIITTWASYTEDNENHNSSFFDDEPYNDFEFEPQNPHINPLKGIGRNDPCPCGSGKKYKKCCGK